MAYLAKFSASEAGLRRVLTNKVTKAVRLDPNFAADKERQQVLHQTIAVLVTRYVKAGVINDALFAEQKVQSLRRAGRSQQRIKQTLAQKGIALELIEATVAGDERPLAEIELEAALRLAKRRRLGRFRAVPADADQARKDMAALARAGFSFDIARQVVGAAAGDYDTD